MKLEKLEEISKNNMAPKIELAYLVLQPKKKKSHRNKGSTNSRNRRQQQTASSQHFWRKTFVLTKVKPKPKLPRIFRVDRKTGLPLDYERTVTKIMRYVNPQSSSNPTPDQLMEELLAQTLVGYLENCNCCRRSALKHHMRMFLQKQGRHAGQKDARNDEKLFEFHCACKRKPFNQEPTYESKFNYNNLKIKSN